MDRYQAALATLRQNPRTWLITGVAGFIGSHLLECLLSLGQSVVGLDNFSTGHPKNIDEALERTAVDARFRAIYGDVREFSVCADACTGVDVVLHHAALASVPGSIADPREYHSVNVDGFVNMLVAARDSMVKRFVYASSSAVYGDDAGTPKREERVGESLSPYGAAKLTTEIQGTLFKRVYGLQTIGLRYFNVFGRRQDPHGAYAAVVPRWVSSLAVDEPCVIMGDGKTTRDFVHVDDVTQANVLSAAAEDDSVTGKTYNVGSGRSTTLNELYHIIRGQVAERRHVAPPPPIYADFRPGDIRHSVADISLISNSLGFAPRRTLAEGVREAIDWYLSMDTPPRPQRRIDIDPISDPPPLSIVPPRRVD